MKHDETFDGLIPLTEEGREFINAMNGNKSKKENQTANQVRPLKHAVNPINQYNIHDRTAVYAAIAYMIETYYRRLDSKTKDNMYNRAVFKAHKKYVKMYYGNSKYTPHQSIREKNRRIRQMKINHV